MNAITHMKLRLVSAIFSVFILLSFHSSNAISDPMLETIKAAEHLTVLSQSVVKDYLYIAKDLNAMQARAQMIKYLKQIDYSLRVLNTNVTNTETLGLLAFLNITYTEMQSTMNRPYTEDNALLIMDMSEVLLEGAEAIGKNLKKKSTSRHTMLIAVEHQWFLLERMAKLYIAARANFYDYNSQQQMKKAIADYDKGLKRISAFTYPSTLRRKVSTLEKNWALSKAFFKDAESGRLPRVVFLATEMMSHSITPLIAYHEDAK